MNARYSQRKKSNGSSKAPLEKTPAQNVLAIVALEREAMEARSPAERISDAVTRHAGRVWFISAHASWFIGWIALNSGMVRGVKPFDPYPYQFLTFVVSLEAIFLSLFILMSQNRSTRQADERSHHDLQINLLAEQESTKMLQMLQSLCAHHKLPIANDKDLETLKQETQPAELLQELKAGLPESC